MQNLTNPARVRALSKQYGIVPTKGFGQNFIVNAGLCPRICDTAGVNSASRVLEIGPGLGTLTRELAQRAAKVVALELDRRLLPVLDETLADLHNVKVVQGDALRADLGGLIRQELGGPAILCANLPYNITTPLLMRLLEESLPLGSATVMVQREVAQRMAAAPGGRQVGALSYAVQYRADVHIAFVVKPGSFWPPPKVESAVVHLALRPAPALAHAPLREARLFRLIRAAFGQRRKTLLNAAAAGLGLEKPALAAALASADIPPAARPEQLSLEDYIRLEAALWPE